MVVDQIHIHDFAIDETEHDSPVAGNTHTPMPSTIAFQWMQVIAGTSHVMRRTGMLQVSQYATDAFDMVSVQPAGVITLEQRS